MYMYMTIQSCSQALIQIKMYHSKPGCYKIFHEVHKVEQTLPIVVAHIANLTHRPKLKIGQHPKISRQNPAISEFYTYLHVHGNLCYFTGMQMTNNISNQWHLLFFALSIKKTIHLSLDTVPEEVIMPVHSRFASSFPCCLEQPYPD